MKNIDLSFSYGDNPVMASSSPAPEKHYPVLHLEGSDLEFPEDGTATFEFCVKRRTESKNSDGSERCEYDLEIRTLKNVKATPGAKDEQPYKRDTSAEDALDKLMSDKQKASESDEY